jgi:murein L,D-transpeptidase YcbB/YkuD
MPVRSAQFGRLLASTALGLVLVLSSHPGQAQQAEQKAQAAVPSPDTNLPPPLTAKDVAPAPAQSAPAPVQPAKDAATVTPPANAVADSAIADKLHEMIGGKLERIASHKADRDAMESFYKAHNYAPIWLSAGAANDRAKSAIATLAQADTVGLDPTDYPVPDFKSAATADALAEAELKLTAAALMFARHEQMGRISYTRVGADIQFEPVAPDSADVLAKLADASDAGPVLDSYNPPQPEFKALRAKLAEVRKNGGVIAKPVEEDKPVMVKVPEGKILRPGMKDARVVALRQRLDVAGDKQNPLYDDAVRDAVKTFQTAADLDTDGNLGANTVKALNGEKHEAKGPTADPVDTIVVNMERWRWLPRDVGNPRVIVNVPDYRLTLWNDGKVYWTTKIVVGKPGKATPMVSAEMKFITVNPTWNVPPSIIENEYLPALREDPQALDRIGLKLVQDPDGTVHVSQPPGAGNALGRIRFNFPNKFLVYQHDTPDKYLFAKDERAFSHGCMRVQNPLTYGEKLLSLVLPQEHYTEAKLEKMFGGSEININFPKNIWVHLTYQTAFVDDDGKLQLRKDVYGRDARMIAILKGSERKVADIAVEQHTNSSSKPVKMPVGMYGGSNGGYSGPGLFDFLFGGARAQQPVYRPPGNVTPRGRISQR